jgi:hypothetical protein
VYNINTFNLAVSGEMFLDETYANGDGTDSWCTTNQQIPVDFYDKKTYASPQCGQWTCFLAELQVGLSPFMFLWNDGVCTDRDAIHTSAKMHFLCM